MTKKAPQLWGGDWTEQKLDALNQYLNAYAKALSKSKFQRVYIDAFAGTGYREQRTDAQAESETIFAEELSPLADAESQRFLDGSAKIALRVTPPFHRFLFIEYKRQKAIELEKLRAEFPQQAAAIDIRSGDANTAIKSICHGWDKRGARGVLFLDPFGMQVEWDAIRAIASTGCIDTWILFPFAANRLMTRYPENIPAGWRNRLDKLFGGNEWESRFYREHRLLDIFGGDKTIVEKNLTMAGLGAYYRERLETLFPAVAPNPRILTNSRGSPLFQLCFAASNPGRGGEIALKIAEHILDNI